ncbi:Vitamin B12 ABC transporter, B12-binding component BtuF [hydrothermal vent metagenome]|uniref:Vitamin B12 ABC transporter, B12-binding component BtuF n=1 Tax=hydrothermal vent metagenome TaxID=652676 RepID=A0A3B1C940_9ZZZZ
MNIKNILLIFLTTIFLILTVTNCKQNDQNNIDHRSEIVDDLDSSFSFTSVPQRVITLAPNLTEMIYELGVDSFLIGNTTYCNYPEAAKGITKVGDLLTVDYEKIVSLKPDLIFITVEGNSKSTYDKLKEYGFKVFVSNPRNYNGIKKTFTDFGKIFNKEELVKTKIAYWDSIVDSIIVQSATPDSSSAMFLISIKPIMLAGGKTFLNEFLKFCGLKNIAASSQVNYPLFSREEILSKNPEYIIHSFMQKNIALDIKNAYPEWKNLSAIKTGNIIAVDPDIFFRPGPRFVIALKYLYDKLH